MRWRSAIRPLLPFIWTFAPMYGTERLANYYFLGRNPAFYTISGLRLEVFIISALVGSVAAGAFLKSFRLAVITQSAAVLSLMAGVFALCDPSVCYSAAPDGLEPVRLAVFLGAVGVSGASIGTAASAQGGRSGWSAALAASAGFVAVAWYPVIFTFAGAKLLTPFDPWASVVVLFLVAFATSAASAPAIGRGYASIVAPAALVLTFALSAGIAYAYLDGLTFDILVMAASATVGGAAGAVFAAPERVVKRRFRLSVSFPLCVSLALVLLMTLVVIPDAVSGVVPTAAPSAQDRMSIGTPVYYGAFMDTPQGHAGGAQVTLNFAGTDAAVIQPDNFLAGGIGVHSPGCCVDGIDYAYRFDLYLFHDGNESLAASGWEACDDNAACGGHSWKVLLVSAEKQLGQQSLDENVTLRMEWNGGELRWAYSLEDGPFANFTWFAAPAPENRDFNTGVSGGVSLSEQKAAYFFQFGVMSRYPIGRGGWRVSFNCPSTSSEDAWTCIPHATSVSGQNSYWKVIWRWGENYPNVAVTSQEFQSAVFQYSAKTTGDFQRLW